MLKGKAQRTPDAADTQLIGDIDVSLIKDTSTLLDLGHHVLVPKPDTATERTSDITVLALCSCPPLKALLVHILATCGTAPDNRLGAVGGV